MEQRLLHTPEGVRDIYSGEYARKKALLQKLHRVVESYGYCDIETPTFEYFDVFSREIGTTPSKDLYKFFDREGNTLVLRPDMTPAIARAYAKYFSDEELGVRLSYMGNTFVNNSSLQGHLKEMTQLGAELIGDGSVEADAEITAMIVEILLASGLTEFQVSIGHVEFFQSLLAQAGVDKAAEQELRRLITNKNNFGVETLLEELKMDEKLTSLFKRLPQMFGNIEVLDQAERMTDNKDALAAIARLRKLYEIIRNYGYEKYISFDLGMLGSYGYYTGVLFRAYTFGTGDAVVKGGRYDQLMGYFGKPAASIGFVVQADELLNALSRQKIAVPVEEGPTLVLYDPKVHEKAIEASIQIRRDGGKAALMLRKKEYPLSVYCAYAKRNALEKVVYFAADGNVQTVKPQEEKSMRYLTFALGKGRLAKKTLELFEKIGITCEEMKDKDSRKLIFVNEELKLRFFLSKGPDVPTYVEYGAADIGIVGEDTILEEQRKLYEVLDLGFGKCRMCVCGPQSAAELLKHQEQIRVATKYPHIAKDYFYNKKHQTVEIVKLNGSIELAPIVGLSDVIVDIVETGSTLRENGLVVLEEVCPLSARVVVNQVSMRMENERITKILTDLKSVIKQEA